MNDPIADFLIRIKNAALAGRQTTSAPHSKIKEKIVGILKEEGFIKDYRVEGENIIISLTKDKNKNRLLEVRRISKPSRRVYVKAKNIGILLRGLGITILSTPEGLMNAKNAQKKNLGGEIICKII